MGAAMGIEPAEGAAVNPNDVTPEMDVSAAVHGYLFSVTVTGREAADQWQVLIKPGGLTEWQLAATATGKSVDVTYTPPAEEPGPATLEVYVQLRRNNANYGQPSQIALVTVNP